MIMSSTQPSESTQPSDSTAASESTTCTGSVPTSLSAEHSESTAVSGSQPSSESTDQKEYTRPLRMGARQRKARAKTAREAAEAAALAHASADVGSAAASGPTVTHAQHQQQEKRDEVVSDWNIDAKWGTALNGMRSDNNRVHVVRDIHNYVFQWLVQTCKEGKKKFVLNHICHTEEMLLEKHAKVTSPGWGLGNQSSFSITALTRPADYDGILSIGIDQVIKQTGNLCAFSIGWEPELSKSFTKEYEKKVFEVGKMLIKKQVLGAFGEIGLAAKKNGVYDRSQMTVFKTMLKIFSQLRDEELNGAQLLLKISIISTRAPRIQSAIEEMANSVIERFPATQNILWVHFRPVVEFVEIFTQGFPNTYFGIGPSILRWNQQERQIFRSVVKDNYIIPHSGDLRPLLGGKSFYFRAETDIKPRSSGCEFLFPHEIDYLLPVVVAFRTNSYNSPTMCFHEDLFMDVHFWQKVSTLFDQVQENFKNVMNMLDANRWVLSYKK